MIARGVGIHLEFRTVPRESHRSADEYEQQCERRGRARERLAVRMALTGGRIVPTNSR